MITITMRFAAEIADLVRGGQLAGGGAAACELSRKLPATTSVKDAVEAVGVPHCEIGAVLRRSRRGSDGGVKLEALVADGDLLTIAAPPPRDPPPGGFLCDQHLGKLARLLRIMGFDVSYSDSWPEAEVARRAINEERVLLSRGRAVLYRKAVTAALLLRSQRCDDQVVEVLRRFRIKEDVRLFGRCSLCNGRLQQVDRGEVGARIPPRTARWLDTYYLCSGCDQLYWAGTHVTALRRRVDRILARAESGPGD